MKACKFYVQSVKHYFCGINISFLNMSLHTNKFYSLKSTKLFQNIWFPPKNCSINKVMGSVPKHSTFWDRSYVMRDRSRLYGTGTPRTYSIVLLKFILFNFYFLSVYLQKLLQPRLQTQLLTLIGFHNLTFSSLPFYSDLRR